MLFATTELQILDDVGLHSTPGKFIKPESSKVFSCRVTNAGLEGAYVVFGKEAVKALNHHDGASGTATCYIPAGEARYIDKGPTGFFAACTDDGPTKLLFEAGKGV